MGCANINLYLKGSVVRSFDLGGEPDVSSVGDVADGRRDGLGW